MVDESRYRSLLESFGWAEKQLQAFSTNEEKVETFTLCCDKPSSKFFYKDYRNIESYIVNLDKVPTEFISGIMTAEETTIGNRNEETLQALQLIPKCYACLNIQPINKDSLYDFFIDCLPETKIQWSRREITEKLIVYCKSNENLLIISRTYAFLGPFIHDRVLKKFMVQFWKALILALVRDKHIV